MAKTRLAKVVLTIRGVWSPTVEYEKLDLVNYLGSSYIAKRDNIGVTPVEGDDWSLSAEKGGKGDQGDKIYLHIAYANSEDGVTDFTTSPVVDRIYTYLGQYSDYTPEGSIVPSKYVWSKLSEEAARAAAELLRVAAEDERVAAETARTSAESQRDSAESARNTAEETRVSNEQSRVSAEINRVSEESARQSAETVRVSSETDRQKAEVSRVDEEKRRVSAETDRADSETKRIEGEQYRVSAEQSRSDAETVRVNNESARKIAEETRVSDESARKTAETSRVSAENTRDTSETNRVNAETSRVNAETVRVNAENARVLAEQGRVTETQVAISGANTAASNAQNVADTVQSKLDAGDFVGPKGEDGYSPTASVSKSGTTTTISITDKTGTTTATVEDGAKGDPGSDANVTAENIKTALGYTPADKVVVDQLTQEMAAFNAGAHDAERDWDILVNHVRDDGKFNTSYAVNGRMTNANPIPVSKNTRIIATELPDYLWAFAKYDASGTFLNGSGWMNISSQSLDHDGYININFKRANGGAVSEADAETIRNGVQIVSRDAIYIKTINGVAPGADGNINLDDVKETYAEIKLINGVTNGNTGKFEYTAANRATIADFISVVKGGKIIFTGAATYNYSPIRLTQDMENVGYMGWIDSAEFELDYTGYLKLNIQRKDGGNMDAEELEKIAKLIKVRTNPIDDPVYKYQREVRADLINSITLEFNRTEGASYQLVRIPMTTNDGRKVRPVVRLTSVDGSLNGEKCSTLTYAKRENTAFAMNAGLFDVANAVPLGQTIIDGVSIVNTPHPQGANGETISETECYPLCIDANGWLSAPYPKTVDTATMIADGVVQATTGWVKLVENYEIAADEIATEIVHPQPYVQNVIGQFDNGDYIVCSVSNKGYGNIAPNDNGLTYTQVAQILVDKGVKFAYALDGGGSAQTVLGMRHINPIYEGTTGRAIPSVIVFKAV